jgi:hypothetical protein
MVMAGNSLPQYGRLNLMNIAKSVLPVFCALVVSALFSACSTEAIWVSRDQIDFDRDESPMYFHVANNNAEMGTFTVNITGNKNWIKVSPQTIPCKPPTESGMVMERIEVRIDRSRITSTGKHTGEIQLRASGIKTVTLKVSVVQTSVNPTLPPLSINNPVVTYKSPSLIEFAFSLRDQKDRAVTGEPAQFGLQAFESRRPVGTPEGLTLRRGASRQLWLSLVMDYSQYMTEIGENAIDEMERVATEALLPSLNEDALVSVRAFYRNTENSKEIVPFTVNREFAAQEIREIRSKYLPGFNSGARVYEALLAAIQRFPEEERTEKDDRYIVLFCNGRDTTGVPSMEIVREAALKKKVQIFVACLGDSMDADKLITLARSTNGRFVAADSLNTLQTAFQRIVEDLYGQYIVRWASGREDTFNIIPSITLTYNGAAASYEASKAFVPSQHLGDRMRGELILVQSETPGKNTTVFLRAHYVPYGISALQLRVQSSHSYDVALVDAIDDGLLAGWQLETEDTQAGEKLIRATGSASIPFAAFGAMLRFEFDEEVEDAFTSFVIENAGYVDGQRFVLM